MEKPASTDQSSNIATPFTGTRVTELDAEIQSLNVVLGTGTATTKQLAQYQADLIDRYKELMPVKVKLEEALEKEQGHLKVLQKDMAKDSLAKLTNTAHIRKSRAAIKLLTNSLAVFEEKTTDTAKALQSIIKYTEKEETTAKKQEIWRNKLSGLSSQMSKTSAVTDAVKMASSYAAGGSTKYLKVLTQVGKLAGFAGGTLVILSALSDMFLRATRATKDYVNAFGPEVGLHVDAQIAFRKGIGRFNKALYSSAEVQKAYTNALSSGAYGAHLFTNILGRSTSAQAAAGTSMESFQKQMGQLSVEMLQVGGAIGMTVEESGKLFGSLLTTMGAFGDLRNTVGPTSKGLSKIMDNFKYLRTNTSLQYNQLIPLMNEFSAVTIPLGISFDSLTMKVGKTVAAIGKHIDKSDEATASWLSSSAAIVALTKGMFGYGKSITPFKTYGYQLVTGTAKGATTTEGMMEAISRGPFQRIADQVGALTKTGLSSSDLGVALMQEGMQPAIAKEIWKMQKGGTFEGVMAALGSAGTTADMDKLIVGASGAEKEALISINNTVQAMGDPVTRITTVLSNILDELSVLAAAAISFFTKSWIGGSAPQTSKAKKATKDRLGGSTSIVRRGPK